MDCISVPNSTIESQHSTGYQNKLACPWGFSYVKNRLYHHWSSRPPRTTPRPPNRSSIPFIQVCHVVIANCPYLHCRRPPSSNKFALETFLTLAVMDGNRQTPAHVADEGDMMSQDDASCGVVEHEWTHEHLDPDQMSPDYAALLSLVVGIVGVAFQVSMDECGVEYYWHGQPLIAALQSLVGNTLYDMHTAVYWYISRRSEQAHHIKCLTNDAICVVCA
jgi:hypothetical protein